MELVEEAVKGSAWETERAAGRPACGAAWRSVEGEGEEISGQVAARERSAGEGVSELREGERGFKNSKSPAGWPSLLCLEK